MQSRNWGFFYIFLSGLCYGVMVIFVRFLAKEIPPFSQVFLRYMVAATAAFSFAKVTSTNLRFKYRNEYVVMILIGIFGYGLTNAFYTLGIIYTTVASAEFIFSTFVILVPVLAFILLPEKPSKIVVISITLSIIGTYLLFNPSSLNSIKGGFYAAIAALGNAIYIIGSRKLKNYSAKKLLVYSTLCGVISIGTVALTFEKNFYLSSIFKLSQLSWLVIVIFGLDNFIAWLLLNKGLQTVKAGIASIILLITPVFATFIGIIVYKETLSIGSMLGIVFIISGIILVTRE